MAAGGRAISSERRLRGARVAPLVWALSGPRVDALTLDAREGGLGRIRTRTVSVVVVVVVVVVLETTPAPRQPNPQMWIVSGGACAGRGAHVLRPVDSTLARDGLLVANRRVAGAHVRGPRNHARGEDGRGGV